MSKELGRVGAGSLIESGTFENSRMEGGLRSRLGIFLAVLGFGRGK